MSLQQDYDDARVAIVALRNEVEARRASEALLAAALKRADAEVGRLRAENQLAWNTAGAAEAERDRLRAVLEEARENVETLVQAVGERYITQAAVCTILAAQRSLAALVTP